MDHQMPSLDRSSLVKLIRNDKKLHSITLGIYSTEISEMKTARFVSARLKYFVTKKQILLRV